MSRLIQVRNVPDEVHRALKVHAAEHGRTLSAYLLAELERVAARPTTAHCADAGAAGQARGRCPGEGEVAATVREGRGSERRTRGAGVLRSAPAEGLAPSSRALKERIWTLRDAFSAYAAAYVAMAEMLAAPPLTADAGVAKAAAQLVEVIAA